MSIRRLAHLTLITWLLLAATGVWLMFFYQPTAGAAYADMATLRGEISGGVWIRRTHIVLAVPAVVVPMTVTFLHVAGSHFRRAWIALGAAMSVGFAWFSGLWLPWDQLALWAVTTGSSMRGYSPVFGDNVRFVLLGGAEVSSETIVFWFRIHTVVIPLAMLTLAIVYWRRTVRFQAESLRLAAGRHGDTPETG